MRKAGAPAVGGARFFVDANDLAMAKGLAMLRRDVVYPGHASLPGVRPDTPDSVWIPIVGSAGLVVLTRDQKIRKRPIELEQWRNGGLRGFVLTAAGQLGTWDSVRHLARWWEEVEAIIAERPDGPWMYSVVGGRAPKELALEASR
jgi:hypothetical protein